MREALREWKQLRLERDRARDEIGRLWDEGLTSGAALDGEDTLKLLKRRFRS